MASDMPITIELSDAQVTHVLREVSRDAGVGGVLGMFTGLELLDVSLRSMIDDGRYSRGLLRGLLVLSAFPSDGSMQAITEIAGDLDINKSTVHRYLATLLALGVLEQDPQSRYYRRPAMPARGVSEGGA